MEVNDLIKKAVDAINNHALSCVEKRVERLVAEILETNRSIVSSTEHIVALKKELKGLQLPTTQSVEL